MPLRSLAPAPPAVLDPRTGLPLYGSYVGSIPRVDLSALAGGALRRIAREKRWVYVALASADTFVAFAIARFGYAATAFAYVFDAASNRMVATASVLAPPTACHVTDGGIGGPLAAFRFGAARAAVERTGAGYAVQMKLQGIELSAELDAGAAPPAVTAVARVGEDDGLVNTTQKRALLAARGELRVGDFRRELRAALAGYDYTHGLLARRTMWRWAFGLGHAASGEKVGFNLVQGFVGEPECAAWVDDEVFPLREGRFAFDTRQPLAEWRVTTTDGGVDLRFKPGGMHAERKNLGLVASRFVQPAGVYTGTLRAGGRELVLGRVLGVTEDQDVLW